MQYTTPPIESPITPEQIGQRMAALRTLHLEFFKELQETGLGFHPELGGAIGKNYVGLGIKNPKDPNNLHSSEFGSGVEIRTAHKNIIGEYKAEIGVPGSGSFSPDSQAQYWKIKHACIILDNWDLIQGICEKYCQRYEMEFMNQ